MISFDLVYILSKQVKNDKRIIRKISNKGYVQLGRG